MGNSLGNSQSKDGTKDRLVIFDHDGLMVNTEDVVYAVLTEIAAEHGCAFPWDYYCTTLGMPVAGAIAMYVRDMPLGLTVEELTRIRGERVAERMLTDLHPMPGLRPLLAYLAARGVRMAVATSGTRPYITRTLERFDLARYFEAVVCIDDVERGKPHPDLILEVLRRTGVPPRDAVMLEDAPHGVEAARRAGVFCIAVPTHGLPLDQFASAGVVAANLEAVLQLLSFTP